ncbi:MAG TPA: hypothetical protein VGH20_14635 [Myxococcales bacterium]|jgi:hypothetical protein
MQSGLRLAPRWVFGLWVGLPFLLIPVSFARAACVVSRAPECKLGSPLLQGFLEAEGPFVCRDQVPNFDADGMYPPSPPSDPVDAAIADFARGHGDQAIPFYLEVIERCPWNDEAAYQALAALGTPKAMDALKSYAYRNSRIDLLLAVPGYETPKNMAEELRRIASPSERDYMACWLFKRGDESAAPALRAAIEQEREPKTVELLSRALNQIEHPQMCTFKHGQPSFIMPGAQLCDYQCPDCSGGIREVSRRQSGGCAPSISILEAEPLSGRVRRRRRGKGVVEVEEHVSGVHPSHHQKQ